MPLNATNRTVTWISSDESKATVSNTGEVTANAPGEVYITASANDGSNVSAAKTVTVKSNDASLTAMTLGATKHAVTPVEGQTVNLKNVERTFYSSLTAVPVTITAAAGATVKTGTTDFTSGGNVDFTNPVVFTVTAADGVTTKTYTVGIQAYDVANNPYGVYTAAHLNDVRNDKAGSYLLKNNITLPERNEAGKTATGIDDYATAGWLPIAHDAVSGGLTVTGGFSGIFDGGSHSIDNFYINRGTQFIGLFGATLNATIRNLGVNGVGDGTAVTGLRWVGLVAGYSDNSTITQCFSTGNIAASQADIRFYSICGGLVGYAGNCTISKCYAAGDVTVSTVDGHAMAGGLIGQQERGSTTDCYATNGVTAVTRGEARPYAGGLVGGLTNGSISNSYATGNIVSSSERGEAVIKAGGFLASAENSTLTNNYRNSSATIMKNNVNAEANDTSIAGITDKTKAEMQNDTFKGSLNGSGSIWGRDANKNDGLPYIQGVGVGK